MIKFQLQKGQQQLRKQLSGFLTQQNLIEIFIDDVPQKLTHQQQYFKHVILAGVIILRFCYHERLAVAGKCRMCLVKLKNHQKTLINQMKILKVCSMCNIVTSGMRILTKSEKTRIAVMEFMLANLLLDCPICDQEGERYLQDISVIWIWRQQTQQIQRAVEDKNFGPLVATSMNRCIHCTRCVRFSDEYAGVTELATCGRGRSTEIGTYIDKTITSELQGNLADICPVGALTNGPYVFTSR